jgi:hypothetical protein
VIARLCVPQRHAVTLAPSPPFANRASPPSPLCLPCSAGFAPELFGKPLEEGQVLETDVLDKQGLQYYQWFVKPHHLVSATAEGNRLFILNVNASSVQWRKGAQLLRVVQQSFFVPRAVVKPL